MQKSPVVALTVFLAVAAGTPARAEKQFDFFVGWSRTESATVTSRYSGFWDPTSEEASREVDFRDSFSGGIGFKAWLPDPDWSIVGCGLDISGFTAHGQGTRFDVFPFGISLLFRYPFFRDRSHPYGVLRPYLGLGFDLVAGKGSTDWDEMVHDVSASLSDGDSWGTHAALGMNWAVSDGFGLFLEYRYTHLRIDARDTNEEEFLGLFNTEEEKIDTELRTQHCWAGWSVLW